jgi:GNAT superfamily N-acetyltransferase
VTPSEPTFEVRRLSPADLDAFQASMPSWNAREYAARLGYENRGLAVQLLAWSATEAVGRGMLVRAGHPEWSPSAYREGCPEIRDVGVAEHWRRRGVGSAIIRGLEDAAREAGADRIGLGVGLDEDYAAARSLYERWGYRFAHGPFIAAASLDRDDATTFPVAGVCEFRTKDL